MLGLRTVSVIFVRSKLLNDLSLLLSCSFVKGSHYNPYTSYGFHSDGSPGLARTIIWFSHNNAVLVYLLYMTVTGNQNTVTCRLCI